ncbi:MAG: hypothetical protein IJX88_06320 [Clostridia bacterium]|nr:hypothetical protein [Clostridia bacterium]
MENKEENVYVNEAESAGQTGAGCAIEENGSAALGKFKSVDALLQAYGALEAEFTRRSQRLKKLEKEAENLKKAQAVEDGAEKLRKIAEERKAEAAEFDSYVAELEGRVERPAETEEEGEAGAAPSVAESRVSAPLPTDTLYEQASRDESVRLRIIGEYLSSIGKAGAPLMRGGAGTLVAPPLKAKSVEEAGSMALRFFKNDGLQA